MLSGTLQTAQQFSSYNAYKLYLFLNEQWSTLTHNLHPSFLADSP